MSALVIGAIQRAEAAVWITINGRVLSQTGEPVCAMVLANGQHMFSCDGNGTYDLRVPLDSSGNITLQSFATGFAPFSQTLTAVQAANINDVSMDRDTTGRAFTITHFVSPPLPNGWVTVSGTIHKNGTPLCAVILINGQSMFSCDPNLGQYSLEVPRDSNGKITLQAFAAGFMPHRDTFGVNDPPIATGRCNTTLQAETFSGILNATDPEDADSLMYSFPSGSTDTTLTTAKGGEVTITDQTTGAFTYQPDMAAGDKRGKDSFYFQVSDPDGGVSSATETVVIGQTIMPLGDSITLGSVCIAGTGADGSCLEGGFAPDKVGYRKPLFDTLDDLGYTFDFVGSLENGSVVLIDFDHEGHGGWTASEIAWGRELFPTDGVRAWLNSNPADFILLHAGTNALDPSADIDIEVILDEIDLWENSASGNPVTVILALIIDQNPNNPDVTAFNNNVLAMANSRITEGDDIIIVNQQDALNYLDDMSDTLHPNDNGYTRMAPVWFNALENVLDKCP